MHLKMSSAKWRPFCPGGDELISADQDEWSHFVSLKDFFLNPAPWYLSCGKWIIGLIFCNAERPFHISTHYTKFPDLSDFPEAWVPCTFEQGAVQKWSQAHQSKRTLKFTTLYWILFFNVWVRNFAWNFKLKGKSEGFDSCDQPCNLAWIRSGPVFYLISWVK